MTVDVRPVSRADAQALAAAFPEPPGTPSNRHLRRFALQERGSVTMLAAWNRADPVGYCIVRWADDGDEGRSEHAAALGCAELADLYVTEHVRRRGVGRMLVAAAERLAADRGIDRLGLEVTAANPCNEAARRLYERCGYRDAGLGEFTSGYSYFTPDGVEHRDEEPHVYMVKPVEARHAGAQEARSHLPTRR